jgi:hypothetical protein
MNFKSVLSVLGVAVLGLAAVANDGNGNDVAAVPCAGCAFVDASSPPNPGPGPNPCGTELRISVFGMSGRCERPAPGGVCAPAAACLGLRVVEVKSACKTQLEWRPDTGGVLVTVLPAIGGWNLVDFSLLDMSCGGPAQSGYYKLTDSTGFTVTNSYFYRCTGCED